MVVADTLDSPPPKSPTGLGLPGYKIDKFTLNLNLNINIAALTLPVLTDSLVNICTGWYERLAP